MRIAIRLILLLVIFSYFASGQSTPQKLKASTIFSKQAITKAIDQLKALQKISPYRVGITLPIFLLNQDKTLLIPAGVSAVAGRKLVFSAEEKIENKFDKLVNKVLKKTQNRIEKKKHTEKEIILIFSIGIYYDQYKDTHQKITLEDYDAAIGNEVPQKIVNGITDFTPVNSLDLNDPTHAVNDALLDEFIQHVVQVISPKSNKSYIAMGNKKYYDNDVAYVVKSDMLVRFRAFNHLDIPFGDDTRWDNATPTQNDKSIAEFTKNVESKDLSGTTIKVSSENTSVSIKVVVIGILYAQSSHSTFGFDDNDPVLCQQYPSFNTLPIPGMPWQILPGDGDFVPVKVSVTPIGVLKKIELEFESSDIKYFKVKPKLKKINDSELQLLIAAMENSYHEGDIIPVIDGEKFASAAIKVVSYSEVLKDLTVIMVEEKNDDIQLIPYGSTNLDPMTATVMTGLDRFLDSRFAVGGDDKIVEARDGIPAYITAGKNGIAETKAVDKNVSLGVHVDATDFEKTLDKIYAPCLVTWTVDPEPFIMPVNYDINYDDKLNLADPDSEEQATIHEALFEIIFHGDGEMAEYRVCLIKAADVNLLSSDQYDFAPYFFIDNIRELKKIENKKNLMKKLYEIAGRELAHRAFLLNYYQDSNSKDYDNLMHNRERMQLRKFQWDIIHMIEAP